MSERTTVATVKVTASDVRDGRMRSARTCPIALAIERCFGHRLDGRVSVDQDSVLFTARYTNEQDRLLFLDTTSRRFVRAFDDHGYGVFTEYVFPFTVTLSEEDPHVRV